MQVGKLLDIVRGSDLDDVVQPYLWSDADLLEYADDAQNEACRRARLIVDSTTPATCSVAVSAGVAVCALDSRVIRVNRAKLAGQSAPLAFCMLRDLDARYPGWEDWSETPLLIVPDWQSGKVRLVGTPNAAGTLALTVVRLPLVPINDLDATFELREEYLRSLRHWITYRAFLKRDSETYNEKRALVALELFEREFGRPQPAYDEMWAQSHYSQDPFNGRY